MKVLISCLSRSWGGMEMVALNLVDELIKRNIKTELLCYKESRINIEANSLATIIHPVKASGYFHPLVVIKILSILKNGNYDIVHSHASKDLWVLVPALKLFNRPTPLLLTKHVGSFIIKKDFLHRFIYSRVTKAIAISKVIKKNLVDTTPLTESKIELLYNGIDIKKFDPGNVNNSKFREEIKIGKEKLAIGMMARFSRGKGHEEFIQAANNLSKKYDNLIFVVVGESSRGEEVYTEQIKNLAGNYSLTNLFFTGYRSDIPETLAGMDIFVFPSHAEAFGVALVEAMAMRLPTVTSDSDGVLDIAVDNVTSLMFKKKNAADLEQKLEILINNPDLRKNLGAAGREIVLKSFNKEITINKTIDFYKQVISKNEKSYAE